MDPIIEVAGMAVNRFEFFSFFKTRSWIIILISMFQQESYEENGEYFKIFQGDHFKTKFR